MGPPHINHAQPLASFNEQCLNIQETNVLKGYKSYAETHRKKKSEKKVSYVPLIWKNA